ncbi:hypothetical protein ACOSQ3_010171 [Xanthoceras sorbifolium]
MPVLEFVLWCHAHVNQLQLETLCIVWWRVWSFRNRVLHSSSIFPITEVVPWSSAFLADYQAANLKPTLTPLGRVMRWKAPEIDWYKLNCDAAVNVREKKIGLGVVILDDIPVGVSSRKKCRQARLERLRP